MKQLNVFLILMAFSCSYAIGQSDTNTSHEKFIDDYVQKLDGSLSFQNGINTLIEKPANDLDALRKGFSTSQCDLESNGEWILLFAKNVVIDQENYRAVLYEHQSIKHMAIFKPDKDGMYYFRIWC